MLTNGHASSSSASSSSRPRVVYASRAVLPDHDDLQPVLLHVDPSSGTIGHVVSGSQAQKARASLVHDDEQDVYDVDENHVLLPGLIDTHVHLNQPGRTAWEGFQSGTMAALSGGVTTLIDMPLNSIPSTTTLDALRVKREEAARVGVNCDVGFWGGIVPGNQGELRGMLEAGVKGFKCFLIDSGVEEFPWVQEGDLVKACEALKGTNALILFHAELGQEGSHEVLPPHHHPHPERHNVPSEYSFFLQSRPPALELDALALILKLCRAYPDLRFHIVHLSAADAIPEIRAARTGGVRNLTVETCFHYLTLSAEDVPDWATQFKCCPPIRDERNRRAIVQGLRDGDIDFVVSDHSPCVPELKKGDFMSAWGGISGLGLGLSLIWTLLGDQVSLRRVTDWLCSTQAAQVGLERSKGSLERGKRADFVVFDPTAKYTVTEADLVFKNKVSPYIGRELTGRVLQTYLGGRLVWDGGKPTLPTEPVGSLV